MHWHRRLLPKYNSSSTDTERNNYKWDLLKLKIFYKAKDTVNKTKWQLIEWEKIFINTT